MKKATQNYIVDLIIGIAFIVSAISGLVFLVPIDFAALAPGEMATVLGINFRVWNTLHTYSGLAMTAGVFLHLVLHGRWIWTMTKRFVQRPAKPSAATKSAPTPDSAPSGVRS